MHAPQEFERYYSKDEVLKLLKAIYWIKQATMAFWNELLKCMKDMEYKRNKTDPCMYFLWTEKGLAIRSSLADDCMLWGHKDIVARDKKKLTDWFDCEDIGSIKKYVVCKITCNEKEKSIKLT